MADVDTGWPDLPADGDPRPPWPGRPVPRQEADDEASLRRLIFATLAERRQLSLSYAELSELVVSWHRARVQQLLITLGVDTEDTDAQG